MKRFAKIVQSDGRGQIVIPKDVRQELGIEDGTAFWLYAIDDEGILLKIIPYQELSNHQDLLQNVKAKANKIRLQQKNLDKAAKKYHRRQKGNFTDV